MKTYIKWFENVGIKDVPIVGGKNAALGEMLRALKEKGIRVPDGFATTAEAYWNFLEANHLKDRINFRMGEIKDKDESPKKAG